MVLNGFYYLGLILMKLWEIRYNFIFGVKEDIRLYGYREKKFYKILVGLFKKIRCFVSVNMF